MPSIQFKIWETLLKANHFITDWKQAGELKQGKPWEMPDPPKLLNRLIKIEHYEQNSQKVFICSPGKITSKKIILYLHGGGYFLRIMLPHWMFVQKLSNEFGMKVILPDYPTVPDYSYIDTYNFALDTYKKLLEEYDPEDIYVFGDSAGGGLSLCLAQGLAEESLPMPSKLVLFSPWLDVSMTNPEIKDIEKEDIMLSLDKLLFAGKLYSKDADLRDPRISPLYGNLKGLPEITIFIGTHDILLPDCRKFKLLAEEAGVSLNYFEYKEMLHCWVLFPIPEAEEVIEKIKTLLLTPS